MFTFMNYMHFLKYCIRKAVGKRHIYIKVFLSVLNKFCQQLPPMTKQLFLPSGQLKQIPEDVSMFLWYMG